MSAAATTPAPAPAVRRSQASSLQRFGQIASTVLLLVAAMALIAVLVAGANGLRVRVEQTGSMAPAIQPGDLVIVRQTPIEAIRIGDVIGVQTAAGAVIVHRVKQLDAAPGALRVTTQGDANPTSEDWTIPRTDQVALVRGVVPELGRGVDALKGPLAALAVLLAGLILAMTQLRSIWKRPA